MQTPVFLDYHSTSPCLPSVISAMLPYFAGADFGNPAGRNGHHARAAAALQQSVTHIAQLIGAHPAEITLTSGATEANNLALAGMAGAAVDTARNEILISAMEHDSLWQTAAMLEKRGYKLRLIPVTSEGFVMPETVAAMVSDKTLLVSVMLANHEIGTVQDIAAMTPIVRKAGAAFHTDATQAAGRMTLDVKALGVDMLSFSAHKLGGPQGIGALYVRAQSAFPLMPQSFGGGQQRLRAGTVPLALAVGFGQACRDAARDMHVQQQHRQDCAALFLETLKADGVAFHLNGAAENRLAGSLNLYLPDVRAVDLLWEMSSSVTLSSGAACAAGKPSRTLSAIGCTDVRIDGSIRLCFGCENTPAEAVFAAHAITEALQKI